MRNRIKQLLGKEEGFTLVELLGVIVILGLLIAIAIPSVGNIIDNATAEATTAEHQLVEDAARLYSIDNDIPAAGLPVSELYDNGFLESRGDKDELGGIVKEGENGEIIYDPTGTPSN